MGMRQPPYLAVDDDLQQPFEALLVVIHAGTEIGDDLERPALASAVQFQHLFLPLQIILLVVTGNAGIGHGAALGVRLGAKQLGLELGEVVTTMAARRVLGGQPARCLPAAQGRDGHAQRRSSFTYAYQSLHVGKYCVH